VSKNGAEKKSSIPKEHSAHQAEAIGSVGENTVQKWKERGRARPTPHRGLERERERVGMVQPGKKSNSFAKGWQRWQAALQACTPAAAEVTPSLCPINAAANCQITTNRYSTSAR